MYKTQIACIIIILYIVIFYFSAEHKTVAGKRYGLLLITSIIQIVFDICSIYTVNHLETVSPLLNRFIHVMFMGLMLLLFVIGYKYLEAMVEEEKGERIYRVKCLYIPLVMGVLGLIFLPLNYIETPNGNYSHGPAVIFLYACVAFCIALIVRLMIKYNKDIPEKKRKAVMVAMLSEVPIAAYQIVVPTSLISCLAIVLFILGFYMTVENPDAKLVKLLEKETRRADVANRAKTNFLANMSHEIRTPINAVLGMNEMILRETKEENVKEYARDVHGAAKSLLSIINDILDVTKIEAGKLTIVPVEYDFSAMIRDVTNMISFKARAKDLEFDVKVDECIPGKMLGDDIRIRQILVNLLNNAVKYTEVGKVQLKISLLPDSTEENAFILFRVADTGIGIKSEDLPKLFVAFERIEEKRNRNIEGTGLGMNITRQLLNLLDSKLEVESEYGKGSVFSFVLEQQIIDAQPIGRYEEINSHTYTDEEYLTTYKAPDAKILVVDDNAMNRKVFKNLLKDKDIQIDEASSGKECLERITHKSYHIIFMDHMMPELDGIEAFHIMKSSNQHMCKDTPVVILTANAVAGAKEQYLQEGFAAFLSKPLNPSSLDEVIKHLLDDSLICAADTCIDTLSEDTPTDIDKLPMVDGLDWSYAIRHFNKKSDMLEAVRVFCDAINYNGKVLEKYYFELPDMNALENFRITVHSMKSTAGTIGILPLTGMAKLLEDTAKNNDIETIHQLMPVFIKSWYSYKEHLKMFAADQKSTKQAMDFQEEINEIFKDIRLQASAMDIDALDFSLEKLNEYEFTGEQKELYENIKGAISNLDVEFLENIRFDT